MGGGGINDHYEDEVECPRGIWGGKGGRMISTGREEDG